ncbi:hypothetical protein MYCTH_2129417 [Thermothelomyces thermophilus ATCC 42464]|uniref:Uncharacterized protein n=1 Tax=Thermothelomyces thermophilus (strain ATCC 42464 / BCRC 31852 / DSM 1799) TaxID=573729 RepID=G2QIF1_THET4|nr:uncharacterized protein MYCTH_2129417 [Thermothelomyces thermophilus ATCC 42464]AEO60325.1 hypothetical protein MYCTH_2129417 [Thermothelomyces thermophilus ATCC 42464]
MLYQLAGDCRFVEKQPLDAAPIMNDNPPFSVNEAHLGGVPTPIPDTPLTIIFLVLFTLALVLSITFYQLDRTRLRPDDYSDDGPDDDPDDHRHSSLFRRLVPPPLLPALRAGFILTRLAALATRLVWTYHPGTRDLEMASTILAPAGTVLPLIANVLLARRFLRDYAVFGPHPAVVRSARAAVFCAVAALVMAVSAHADSYFTREPEELDRGRSVWLAAECIRLAVAVLAPLAVLAGGWGLPAREEVERDKPRFAGRAAMICGVGVLLTLQQGLRTGVAFEGRGPESQAWFLHKAAYYCFVDLIDLAIVCWFLVARMDPRFRVRRPTALMKDKESPDGAGTMVPAWSESWRDRVNTEMEVFGNSG